MWLPKLARVARTVGREALILAFAARDPATPMPLRVAAVAALAYVISPVDLVPDLPLIGWVDDLLLVSVGVPYLIRRLPPAVYLRSSAKAERLLAAVQRFTGSRPDPDRGKTRRRGRDAARGVASEATIVGEPGEASRARPRRGPRGRA